MKKPDLTGLTTEQVRYVNELEGCLNGSSELIQQLNLTSRVMSNDLEKINSGDSVEWVSDGDNDVPKSTLVLLSGDSKDKTFERVMVLFDKIDKIKALSSYFKQTEEATKEKEKSSSKLKIPSGGNAFEVVINEVKSKQNGRG